MSKRDTYMGRVDWGFPTCGIEDRGFYYGTSGFKESGQTLESVF